MGGGSRGALSRWWWPVEWLRIAYGVWVDQLWYWQNVRPRLRGWTEGWGILGQAVLGAAVATVLPVALLIGAVRATGQLASSLEVLKAAILGMGSVVAIHVVGRRVRFLTSLAACVAGGPVYVLVISLAFAVALGGGWDALAGKSPGLGTLWSTALGLTVGWARATYEGLTSGVREHLSKYTVAVAIYFGYFIVGSTARNPYAAVPAGVAFLAAFWLGSRWSTRQVADEEARRRLANPEVQAPESRAEARG